MPFDYYQNYGPSTFHTTAPASLYKGDEAVYAPAQYPYGDAEWSGTCRRPCPAGSYYNPYSSVCLSMADYYNPPGMRPGYTYPSGMP